MSMISILNSILLISVIIVRLWVCNDNAKSHALKTGC
jgi:hypothetical protein